jgi:hypothetical protein
MVRYLKPRFLFLSFASKSRGLGFRTRFNNIIKMDIKEILWEDVDCIHLARVRLF